MLFLSYVVALLGKYSMLRISCHPEIAANTNPDKASSRISSLFFVVAFRAPI